MPLRILFFLAISLSSTGQFQLVAADAGPYCGVYAIYGAASALGVPADFRELLVPQFVSGRRGSTVNDLVEAAMHLGLAARPVAGLGMASLTESGNPLVLHVASFGQLDFYNHWVLFLGMENGKARTVDSKGEVFLMDPAELHARWDGLGIVVGLASERMANFGSIETAALAFRGLAVILTLGATSFIIKRLDRWQNGRWLSALGISTVALIALREVRADLSLWQNPDCVRFIMAAEGHRTFAELSTSDLSTLIKQQHDLLIFDTRYAGDMAYGHIPGARGLPVDLSQHEVSDLLKGVDRSRPVILYCQSKGCHFSDRMAIVLSGFGFDDIRIYPEGWMGWRATYSNEVTKE